MSGGPGISFNEQRLFSLMEDAGTDLLLVSSRHNVRYLTGGYFYPLFLWDTHTRGTRYLPLLAVPLNNIGSAFFLGRPGEKAVMEEDDVWPPRRYETDTIGSAAAAVKAAEILRKEGFGRAVIGIEKASLPADAFEVLVSSLPEAQLRDAAGILDRLRAVKSPREIEIIRTGTDRLTAAVETVLNSGRDGVSTLELRDTLAGEFRKLDLHFLYSLICAGPDFFRAPSSKRVWRDGNILHIDSGGMLEGYIVEICRTGFLGARDPLAEELLENCYQLESAVLPEVHPGVKASELQKHADQYLQFCRFKGSGKFTAHGIGMVHHEDPVVTRDSNDILEEGMVVSLEMEFLNERAGHVKVEDMAVIRSSGGEVLSKKP